MQRGQWSKRFGMNRWCVEILISLEAARRSGMARLAMRQIAVVVARMSARDVCGVHSWLIKGARVIEAEGLVTRCRVAAERRLGPRSVVGLELTERGVALVEEWMT